MANFCYSIELEPRTLRQRQLTQAREVAADIIQKKEPKEASTTFVQGLRPVTSIKEVVVMVHEIETLNINTDDEDNYIVTHEEKLVNNYITTDQQVTKCQCSCGASAIVNSPAGHDQSQPKEPFSAPF